jgi:hypothetical protein
MLVGQNFAFATGEGSFATFASLVCNIENELFNLFLYQIFVIYPPVHASPNLMNLGSKTYFFHKVLLIRAITLKFA